MACGFGKRHAFADCCVSGYAIEVLQLKCSQAQGNQDFRVETGVGAGEKRADRCVQVKLPA